MNILHLRTWKLECFDEMIPKFCTNKGPLFISRNVFRIFMRPVPFSKLRKFQRIFVSFYSQKVIILIFIFKIHFLSENKFKCALRELHNSSITQKEWITKGHENYSCNLKSLEKAISTYKHRYWDWGRVNDKISELPRRISLTCSNMGSRGCG